MNLYGWLYIYIYIYIYIYLYGYHLDSIRDAPHVVRTKCVKKFTLGEMFSWFH